MKQICKLESYSALVVEELSFYRDSVAGKNLLSVRKGYCPFDDFALLKFDDNGFKCELFCYYHFPELKSKNVCPCHGEFGKKIKRVVGRILNGDK